MLLPHSFYKGKGKFSMSDKKLWSEKIFCAWESLSDGRSDKFYSFLRDSLEVYQRLDDNYLAVRDLLAEAFSGHHGFVLEKEGDKVLFKIPASLFHKETVCDFLKASICEDYHQVKFDQKQKPEIRVWCMETQGKDTIHEISNLAITIYSIYMEREFGKTILYFSTKVTSIAKNPGMNVYEQLNLRIDELLDV